MDSKLDYFNLKQKMSIGERFVIILSLSSPYLLVAFLVNQFSDGGNLLFLFLIGVMLAARLFFFVMSLASSTIFWYVHRRKEFILWFFEYLDEHKFPQANLPSEYVYSYLSRIIDNDKNPAQLRLSAQHLYALLNNGDFGDKMQNSSAAQKALNTYVPKQII